MKASATSQKYSRTTSSAIKDLILDVPLVDQKRDTSDPAWKENTCGICAIKMLMAFKDPTLMDIPVMTFVEEVVARNGYIEGIGWKHQALVDLADRYGISLTFQKRFFYTTPEKKKGLSIIHNHLRAGRPVIVSVFYGFKPGNGGHLVVVRGIRTAGRSVTAYHIQDPYPSARGNQYQVSSEEFISGWRGGMILFNESLF